MSSSCRTTFLRSFIFFSSRINIAIFEESVFSEFDNIMFGNKLIYKNMTQSGPDHEITGAENEDPLR